MANIPIVNFNKIPNKSAKFNQTEYYEGNFDKINEQIVPKINELDTKVSVDIPAQLAEKANKLQEEWIYPSLLNGWVNETQSTGLQFRKTGFGQIEFRGNISGGAENTIAFNLPSGYIPSQTRYAIVVSTLSFGVVYLNFHGTVLIRIKGTGITRVCFDNVIINI